MKKAFLSNSWRMLAAGTLLAASQAGAVSLQISDYRAEKPLACIPLTDARFSLSFIHSVSLTPVEDLYQIETDAQAAYRIVQTAERFIAHGQGLPSMEGEPDAIAFEHHDGEFLLRMQRPIDDLLVRTDQRFKNRLHTGTTTIDLNQWPDTGLRIAPRSHCKKVEQQP